jgi:hypothetical protein
VAKRGAGSGGEEAGDHAGAVAERFVADGVDAAVHAEQAPRLHPAVDVVLGEPKRDELPAADNPALTGSQPSQQNVARASRRAVDATFSAYSAENVARHRQNGRNATFSGHPATIAHPDRKPGPRHKPVSLSMRSLDEPRA